jgi:hypothetical protein
VNSSEVQFNEPVEKWLMGKCTDCYSLVVFEMYEQNAGAEMNALTA